jgi:hypothetical protein
MSSTFDDPRIAAVPARFPESASIVFGPRGRRSLLLAGCALAALVAWVAGDPSSLKAADPELAFLLRGMALIKGAIVAAGLAVLWWRFGWPLSLGTAAGYLAGAWLATGAAMMIWQLTLIAQAALLFHVGEIALLVLAWRDYRDRGDPG